MMGNTPLVCERRRQPFPPTFGGYGHLWPSARGGWDDWMSVGWKCWDSNGDRIEWVITNLLINGRYIGVISHLLTNH